MWDLNFFRNKRIFITGHTGFKGSWLCFLLNQLGAKITGYSLKPQTSPNLFDICKVHKFTRTITGDIRDLDCLRSAIFEAKPEILIHLAAQPIVKVGYAEPVETYSTNVMGTVNVMECVRKCSDIRSVLNVTTDKVYDNKEWLWGYRELDTLDGFDPYSNSKSCSELVTRSYVRSYFNEMRIPVSTARAGNVIGGGDFAENRIIPDCVRAAQTDGIVRVRNQRSIRPYQHVLDPLVCYLLILKKQYSEFEIAGEFNIGPDDEDCVLTGKLVELVCREWQGRLGYTVNPDSGPHETGTLKLDTSKAKTVLNWKPVWHIREAVHYTIDWYKSFMKRDTIEKVMIGQLEDFNKAAKDTANGL